ncbi:hypothetical protein SDC9_201793 [bioreactor metagenome]|uniref:Uncharacterized protein n=1 Tax=bioreactor metagenome TaxID=1076179 RepID=A0A645J0U3_9ZZZZ
MLLNGKEDCDCPKKKCARHGNCKECTQFHQDGKRKPYCMRKSGKDDDTKRKRNIGAV